MYYKKVKENNTTPIYSVGDEVRITRKKKLFDKGYTANWTNKIYTIEKVLHTLPPTYKLEVKGVVLEGSFYEPELQLNKAE